MRTPGASTSGEPPNLFMLPRLYLCGGLWLNGRFHRAYAAYISGILINVVGFAGATGRTVPLAATRIYEISFFTGFGVSALVLQGPVRSRSSR